MAKKARMGKVANGPGDHCSARTAAERRQKHLKGPSKRTDEDDKRFEESFLRLINEVNGAEI